MESQRCVHILGNEVRQDNGDEIHLCHHDFNRYAGADPEFRKRGGHLSEKQLKTKKTC